jgi:hypothetical protein
LAFGLLSRNLNKYSKVQRGSFAFVRYWRKNGSTMRQYIRYSYTSRKPMILVRWEVIYNILIEFGVPMKLVRLIKNVQTKHIRKAVEVNICSIIFLSRMV